MTTAVDSVSIKLTERCDLLCPMCWQTEARLAKTYDPTELTFEELCSLIDDLPAFRAPVFLWGGEPLLRDCAIDVIRHVKKRKLVCFLVTNGTRLAKMAQELVDSRLDFLVVSLDGIGEMHDSIRGVKGAYRRAAEGIERIAALRTARPILSINLVIGEQNHDRLYDIVTELHRFPVQHVQLQLPLFFPADVAEEHDRVVRSLYERGGGTESDFADEIPKVDVGRMMAEIERVQKDFPRVQVFPHNAEPATWFGRDRVRAKELCTTAWDKICVEANGDVITCPDNPETVVGNVRDASIHDVWSGQRVGRVRAWLEENREYPACSYCTYAYVDSASKPSPKLRLGDWRRSKAQ